MADRKLIDDYENALMNLAVSEMMEQYGRDLEEKYENAEDISPSAKAEKEFKKALDKAYRKGKLRSFRIGAAKFGRYAVTVCAAFIIVLTVSVISVDALRSGFLEWIFNNHGDHITVRISDGDDNGFDFDMINVGYLPAGYKLLNYYDDGSVIQASYSNNISKINIKIYSARHSFALDNEDTLSEEVYINEFKGLYQKKKSISTLIWFDHENSYCIFTNDTEISKDEIVEIARSLN